MQDLPRWLRQWSAEDPRQGQNRRRPDEPALARHFEIRTGLPGIPDSRSVMKGLLSGTVQVLSVWEGAKPALKSTHSLFYSISHKESNTKE